MKVEPEINNPYQWLEEWSVVARYFVERRGQSALVFIALLTASGWLILDSLIKRPAMLLALERTLLRMSFTTRHHQTTLRPTPLSLS